MEGIVFHQIPQWHNMLSARYPRTGLPPEHIVVNMEVNTSWGGLFHAFTRLVTALGLALLWRAGGRPDVPWSGRTFAGSLVLGFGLFNVVEGVLDHLVLHVHHVAEGPGHLPWDVGLLAASAVVIAAGGLLIRSGRGDRQPRPELARV